MIAFGSSHRQEIQPQIETDWLRWFEKRAWVLGLLLVFATLALYYPVRHYPFVNYDDTAYVTDNRHVQSGLCWDTVEWAFTSLEWGNWHPLTWLSHALDYQIFQLNPSGHHDVNVLWHVVNVLLLFWVLQQATGFAGRSFMVAGLFALHPVNVDSVVWIAERKNLLSMLFFLLALGAYRWYAREPRMGRYALVALLFALGLMAKPYPGNGTGSVGGILTFDPLVEAQRSALLLLKGQVFVAWASHCDLGNYHGYMMSFNETSLVRSGIYVDTPNGYEGGFWGGGAGPAADSGGSIYAATGNGLYDAGPDYGDSVLRLTWPSISRSIALSDYFTPWDQQTLDYNDSDFGSGGAVLIPDQPGTTYPHLLVQVGKEGTIDLVNRDNMGHFHAGTDSQIVQTLPYAIGGIWGAPAFWNNTVYFGGSYDRLKAFTFDPVGEKLSYSSESPHYFNFPGSTPSISSNGTSNGIAWIIENDTYGGGNAVLRAYDATNLGTELYNSEQNPGRDRVGLAVKFTVPTVADGHVFVGAENQVVMYGLLGQ